MSGNDSEPEVEGLKEANKWDDVEELIFHVRPDTSFEKIAHKWSRAAGKDLAGYKFTYNGGKEINLAETTPKMLEMKAGRKYDIDANIAQVSSSARP
ncbi:hypothetical protein IAT38_007188 [Cryptococcus sp. DSM 104549]